MIIVKQVLNGLALAAMLFVFAGTVDSASAMAKRIPCNICGAPAPIAGAGLPILGIGYGVYWLVRRLRRKPD